MNILVLSQIDVSSKLILSFVLLCLNVKKGVYLFNKIKLYNVLKRSKSFTKMITILSVCGNSYCNEHNRAA